MICILIVIIGVLAGIENRSVMVGATPIVWLLGALLCHWALRQ